MNPSPSVHYVTRTGTATRDSGRLHRGHQILQQNAYPGWFWQEFSIDKNEYQKYLKIFIPE